jgi:predicted nucleic acid-binding protein
MSPKSTPTILLDAGPLIALFAEDDRYHGACVDIAQELDNSFYTTLPTFTEAMYFANKRYGRIAVEALWTMVFDELLVIEPLDMADYQRSAILMRKYADAPMDFADASLVAIAERLNLHTIFTVDRSHFSTYKLHGRKSFTILGP